MALRGRMRPIFRARFLPKIFATKASSRLRRQRIPDFEGSDLREAFQLIRLMVKQPSVGSIADVVRPAFSA